MQSTRHQNADGERGTTGDSVGKGVAVPTGVAACWRAQVSGAIRAVFLGAIDAATNHPQERGVARGILAQFPDHDTR
jgi:hypothetical protein